MLAPYVFVRTFMVVAADRAMARATRSERGQTAAEYLGIIVVVAAIIVAIFKLGLADKISGALGKKIDEIVNGKG